MEKSIFKLKKVVALLLMFTFYACGDQSPIPSVSEAVVDPSIQANFAELGFDARDIRVETHFDLFTKEEKEFYVLENDILISHDQMLDMIAEKQAPKTEQYRTTNLVTGLPRTIQVLGYQSSGSNSSNLDASMKTALQMAIDNYNALDIELTFTLSFGSNTLGKDIVVKRDIGSAGGVAGFPSGGNPFSSATIYSETTSYGLNVLEHVMTHEIGHCLGLRHTDFFNRSISCGSGGNEGSAGYGAIHISGTPSTTNIDMNSVMLACFSSSETGEFSSFDEIAIEELYGTTSGNGNPMISVSPTTIGFGTTGGTFTVSVTSNVNWTVSENSYWVSVNPTSGSNNGTFTIQAFSNNPICEPQRFASVIVNGEAAGSRTINLTQAANPPRPGLECP